MKRSVKRILAATDFSANAADAVAQAAAIAASSGAALRLIHAGNVSGALPDQFELASGHLEAWRHEARRRVGQARDRLAKEAAHLEQRGIALVHEVVDGLADEAIAREAAAHDADLVVVGAHQGNRFLALGSTAERVVRTCERDVMVVRARGDDPATFDRILVATDFTPAADRALDRAMELAAPGASLDLLHCWRLYPLMGDPIGPVIAQDDGALRKALLEDIYARATKLLERHARRDVTTRIIERQDSAAHGILEEANEAEPRYDLLALGSHGHRGLRRWFLGGVAEATVRYAPCSVLVTH